MEAYKRFNAIRDLIGDSTICNEIINILSEDQLMELTDDLQHNFDISEEDIYIMTY